MYLYLSRSMFCVPCSILLRGCTRVVVGDRVIVMLIVTVILILIVILSLRALCHVHQTIIKHSDVDSTNLCAR